MNIALKAEKRKDRHPRQNLITGTVMLFVFCGFLLLMLLRMQRINSSTRILIRI